MPDPAGARSGSRLADARRLDELDQVGGLILIGEPGIGKTTALEQEAERLRAGDGDDETLFVRLGATRQEDVLERRIFESHAYRRWLDGSGRLHLLLDSLDEARLRIPRVAELLLDGLGDAPFDRLVLRLSCRSADRQQRLERRLLERFGDDSFQVRQLAPLRKGDVAAAAAARGLDADDVVDKIVARGLQALAMIPISLGFLLDIVEQTGDLPVDRLDAYERGLARLAAEHDEDRRTGETAGKLDAGQRLAVASRVGAALVLSGRTSVYLDDRPPDADGASVAELAGGREPEVGLAVQSDVAVDANAVTEALGTALFAGFGGRAARLAQVPYGEFLCARWLVARELPSEQLESLLLLETADGPRITPQLAEVCVWLARYSPEFLDRLIDVDPMVLVERGWFELDVPRRERLVASVLRMAATNADLAPDLLFTGMLPVFDHPGLPAQLRTIIGDSSAPLGSRNAARSIAWARDLYPELRDEHLSVALDPAEDEELRVTAIGALAGAPTEYREPLLSLAADAVAPSSVRSAATKAVWPDLLDASALLRLVDDGERHSYTREHWFRGGSLIAKLPTGDLPLALHWASHQHAGHAFDRGADDASDQLLVRAWSLLDDAKIAHPYAAVVARLLAGPGQLLAADMREANPEVLTDSAGRRKLLGLLVERVAGGSVSAISMTRSRPQLLWPDDEPWLRGRLEATHGTETEAGWRLLLDAARAQRESEAALVASVRNELSRVEAGQMAGFWRACRLIEHGALNRSGYRYRELGSDLQALPGWAVLDEDDRERLVNAAHAYLRAGAPRWGSDLRSGRSDGWRPAAVVRGFRLLRDLRPDLLDRLDATVWSSWAPIILWPPWVERSLNRQPDPRPINTWLRQELSRRSPETVRDLIVGWVDEQLERDWPLWSLTLIRAMWTPLLEQPLLERAQRDDIDVENLGTLVELLLTAGSAGGRELAERFASREAIDGSARERERAAFCAAALASHTADGDWNRLWPLMTEDVRFGREVIDLLASRYFLSGRQVPSVLTAPQLLDLLEWTLEHALAEAFSLGALDQWLESLLWELSLRKEPDIPAQLDRLARSHPDRPELRSTYREMVEERLHLGWTPPQPSVVIAMAERSTLRWVRSDRDLRRLVVAALGRAERELQGRPPAAADLWDAGTVKPKPETFLSDWLSRFLVRDLEGRGIVVGREVEVRPHPKGRMGEAVDLLVSAIASAQTEGAPTVTVAIEVKGCWHADAEHALRSQLVARYLDRDHTQGIYVLGFFATERWDASDDRRAAPCQRHSLTGWRDLLDAQATAVRDEGAAGVDAVVLDCSLAT